MRKIVPIGYFCSPIGNGKKLHIFIDGQYVALCSKGPPATEVYHADEDKVCKVCLQCLTDKPRIVTGRGEEG